MDERTMASAFQVPRTEGVRRGFDRRMWALYVLCFGLLMIVLDTTIVTVALPSILIDLQVPAASLSWLMNAYMLTYGGLLLLSGRLGDLYGPRRLLLIGIATFTVASVACGFASSLLTLLIARAVQGLGGAIVASVSLGVIMNLFPEPAERAKAVGLYGLVSAVGGSAGGLFGGLLTQSLGWHSVFLINVPIGVGVCALCFVLLPRDSRAGESRRPLDVAGAFTITGALTLMVYTLVSGGSVGWMSARTVGSLATILLLIIIFLVVERRAPEPLMPPRLFRLRSFTAVNVLGMLWAAGMFAWFVISALYLQRVLGYAPFTIGLSFAPSSVIMAVFSAGVSAKVVARFGAKRPMWIGQLLTVAGLVLLGRAPLGGAFFTDVLPAMLLLGLGSGLASAPMLLVAMEEVNAAETGVASGVINTAFMMGGTLGLAALSSLAQIRTQALQLAGMDPTAALNEGYHIAFLAGAILSVSSVVLGFLILRPPRARPCFSEDAA